MGTPQDILNLVQNKVGRPKIDKMNIYGEDYWIEKAFKIGHYRFDLKTPLVSDRDFVLVGDLFYEGNVIYKVDVSIEHPELPRVKGCVRGVLKIVGYEFTPISEEETKMIYIVCSDAKGLLPDFVKNWAAKE